MILIRFFSLEKTNVQNLSFINCFEVANSIRVFLFLTLVFGGHWRFPIGDEIFYHNLVKKISAFCIVFDGAKNYFVL